MLLKNTWSMEELAKAYAIEIICMNRVPKDIVSDQDRDFYSFLENST